MAQPPSMFRRATREVADLTGRTEAEVDLVLGVAVVAVGAAVALRVLKALVDLGSDVLPRARSH